MITKQKAKELIELFLPEVRWKMGQEDVLVRAKRCALIAVDETIRTLNEDIRDLDVRGNILLDLIEYWREVKQEIENL